MPTSSPLLAALIRGRERKLGRALEAAELAALEAQAAASLHAGVHLATERPLRDAARAAVASLPKALGAAAVPKRQELVQRFPGACRRRRRASARMCAAAIADAGELVRRAIRDGKVQAGPNLPPFARRSSSLYVQQEDLDELLPDGWGRRWPAEASRLARLHGLPPLALPLLVILEWASAFRAPAPKDVRACGAGFQVSLDWLARKLGCSRVWVQALLNRLDPLAQWRRECLELKRENRRRARKGRAPLPAPQRPDGTPLLHRFRRLKRYQDTCPEAAARRVWVDAQGRPHTYVDVRGVCYLTAAGRAVLGRPHRAPAEDITGRTARRRWLISARLRRGHRTLGREVLETRREVASAAAVPQDLSPNHWEASSPKNL